MHDLKELTKDPGFYKGNLARRGVGPEIIDEVISLDSERKALTTEVETGRAEVKKLSKEVGMLKKKGENADEIMHKVAAIKKSIEEKNHELDGILEKQSNLLATIPNLISDDTPEGANEDANKEAFKVGTPKKFPFKVKDHVDIGEQLGCLDFETGAKITGSRFVVYKGALARLERALINFMIDAHVESGYTEAIPPYIVHEHSMFGTGQLPKFKEDSFKIEGRDWYLIPTAEVPLTNIKREELFKMEELPLKYVAYSPCFRSEAGSYGKDTRGLIRLHQFNKVEMVNIVAASESEKAHEDMVNRARFILEELELPYRGVILCGGDIGFSARKTIDLEVWLPAQEKYREISSVSNCWDFQARRAGIRYRNHEGKPEFAHTLNGSGLAVGRTLVAILENYQNEDGSVTIPKKLVPYMGGLEKISK